jgi:hypothetical protein
MTRRMSASNAKNGHGRSEPSEQVRAAMVNAGVSPLDERGVMPLAQARALVRATDEFRKGEGQMIGGTFVLESDRLWAALLSLEDAQEFVREARRLRWYFHPRGDENTALLDRYGDGILPWVLDFVRDDGRLINVPWTIVPILMALDRQDIFDRLWRVRTVVDGIGSEWPGPFAADNPGDADRRQGVRLTEPAPAEPDATANSLVVGWASAHTQIGYGSLARLAKAGDERARFLLRRNAEVHPRTIFGYVRDALGEDEARAAFESAQAPTDLEPVCVLQGLYLAMRNGVWPVFIGREAEPEYQGDPGFEAYHALRLIAVRARESDEWGVVFERLEGSDAESLRVHRYLISSYKGRGHAFDYPAFETDDDADEPRLPEAIEEITVAGPAGDVVLADAMVDELDLRPRRVTAEGVASSRFAVLLRAYLAKFPRAFWGDAHEAAKMLQIDGEYDVVIDCDAFEHILGQLGEGETAGPEGYDAAWRVDQDGSEAYQSLARVLTARDPALFVPGASNLDWRLHARFEPEE